MEQDTRRVQHALQPRPSLRRELSERPLDEITGISARANLLTREVEGRAGGSDGKWPRLERESLVAQELVDGR